MKSLLEEFKQGMDQFADLPANQSSRAVVEQWVAEFTANHPGSEKLLIAFLLNDCRDPFEGML